LEVVPDPKATLPNGTRVCVYWSQAYNCLFPGTVEPLDVPLKKDMVQVVLDDGDMRQVDTANVRMLPPDYRQVCELHFKYTILMNCIYKCEEFRVINYAFFTTPFLPFSL
jgi:hypothetical protein